MNREDHKIPSVVLKMSGITEEDEMEYRTLQDALVLLKRRMSARELIRAAWSLQQLSAELCTHLALHCCPCDGCADDGENGRSCCPYCGTDGICLPQDGSELREIPQPLWEGFLAAGVCPAGLEEWMETGEIVYET